jgi:hypothetical protein
MTIDSEQKTGCGGQSLFELIFAITIAAIVMVAMVSVASISVRNATTSRNKALANRYVNEVDAWLKNEREQHTWTDFKAEMLPADPAHLCLINLSIPSTPGNCASNQFITGTIYLRNLDIAGIDSGKGLEFTTTVSWKEGNLNESVITQTVLTDRIK